MVYGALLSTWKMCIFPWKLLSPMKTASNKKKWDGNIILNWRKLGNLKKNIFYGLWSLRLEKCTFLQEKSSAQCKQLRTKTCYRALYILCMFKTFCLIPGCTMVTIPPEYCANFHGIFRGMEYSPWTGNGIFTLDRKWIITSLARAAARTITYVIRQIMNSFLWVNLKLVKQQ